MILCSTKNGKKVASSAFILHVFREGGALSEIQSRKRILFSICLKSIGYVLYPVNSCSSRGMYKTRFSLEGQEGCKVAVNILYGFDCISNGFDCTMYYSRRHGEEGPAINIQIGAELSSYYGHYDKSDSYN